MRRILPFLIALAACVVWVGAGVLAQDDNKDFQLPPVKLKPDRPTKAKPIPPAPDDREEPKAPTEPEKEEPAPPPAPKPAEKAPPVIAKPAETPKTPPLPPPPAAPTEPAEPPAEIPGSAKEPIKAPDKSREEAIKEAQEFFGTTDQTKPAPAPKKVEPGPDLTLPPPVLAVPEKPEKPARPVDLQAETTEAQMEPTPEADISNLGEVGLVEEVARLRKAYGRALAALKDFYLKRAASHKIEWVSSEIGAFEKVPKVQYLVVAELAGPGLRPVRRIEAADQLFTEGMDYKNYPAIPPGKKEYLKLALQKFTTIIEKYPESDKIDDAAFRMGEIYGGWYFEDWARAVQTYERCWQWAPKTEYPAYFNAAKIYDEKLKNRAKAVELYNRVVADSRNTDLVNQAQDRIRALTGR